MRRLLPFLTLGFAACATNPPPTPPPELSAKYIEVKVLAINDFHGHVKGPSGSVEVDGKRVSAGGGDYLARRIKEIQKYHPHTIVVGAGDMVGASPLLSSLFHDEPAIETLNESQLAINAVGNHEFDEGVEELKRLANGGCHPVDGCQDGDEFAGAKFSFLAANVVITETGKTVFPAYEIREFGGIKVGFIGLTLEGTGDILEPKAREGLEFLDEVETINKAVGELRSQGIESIVVLIHEGGVPADRSNPSGCVGISGPIVEITKGIDDAVDAIVSGHTHQPYVCEIDGKLVTSAKAYGQLITEIDLKISPESGDVVARSATNLVVDDRSPADENVRAIIDKYELVAGPLMNRVVGEITEDIKEDRTEGGDSPMGNLIADMQLDATAAKDKGGAQIAFMNPGGVRGDLRYEPSGSEKPGEVKYEEAHSVQPFANGVVTLTFTGQEVLDILERQWTQKRPRILLVSKGFQYTWSRSAEPGKKVVPGSVKLNGKPIDLEAEYRVTMNSYLAGGGDNFELLQKGRDPLRGPVDIEVFDAYFGANSPVKPPTDVRISVVD